MEGHITRAVGAAEHYDLVIVGGGLSGLAAAHFCRKKAGKGARVLILDKHDDFGGHAKRNEFRLGGRLLLTDSGAQSIESRGKYSYTRHVAIHQAYRALEELPPS